MPNAAALRIMTRNSRMPDSLAADLDAECSACLMGARRLAELFDRYGRDTIETAFDAILDATTETYRREILGKIPDGTYVWEDYAEHDGVDEPRLHTQRITLTKLSTGGPGPGDGGPKLVIDFTGTGPQAKGPINHCGDYVGGNFLKKWLAPILRNLADTPERMAELDVNEGIVPLIEMRFPDKGTLLTPIYPAPTNARTFVILRLLGVLAGVVAKAVDGRMPADQETIRYTGVYGKDRDGNDYLMREVLGGGSGGRYYADGEDTIHVVPDSRNLPTEFTESRFPFVVERLGLAVDSGGAGRHRGGLGYEKQIRMLRDANFMSIADRSILACWGVKGGRAGRPFEVTIDLGGPTERVVDALADAEPVLAGQVIRIRTTGGGGWGDPLERPYDEVERDLRWGKVSFAGRPGRLRGGRERQQGRAGHRPHGIRRPARRAPRPAHGRGAVLRPRAGVRDAVRRRDRRRGRLRLTDWAGWRPWMPSTGGPRTRARWWWSALRARPAEPSPRSCSLAGRRCVPSCAQAGSPPLPPAPCPSSSTWSPGRGWRAALDGARAAYHLAPNVHADEVGMAARVADAALATSLPRLVFHSVLHPDDDRMPHHLRKAEAEAVLGDALGDLLTVLRPAAYHQNLLEQARSGAHPGALLARRPLHERRPARRRRGRCRGARRRSLRRGPRPGGPRGAHDSRAHRAGRGRAGPFGE